MQFLRRTAPDEETLRAAEAAGAEAAMRKHRLLADVGERLRSIHIDSRRRLSAVA